jgi:UDP-N-acetylglucosamine--N-acetylmuramyl-(pentapeptide) pyrophosphoryl-undecaprenol N-acetylglucosamine transferase
MWEAIDEAFRESGMEGEVVPFIKEMPAAFSEADVIVCRSGAGAVAEVAAAGKPSILVPFPYATDDHQLRNAEAFQREGAARLVPDREFTGQRLFDEVRSLCAAPETLERMGNAARRLARPGAAERAARILEEISRTSGAAAIDRDGGSRNNTL